MALKDIAAKLNSCISSSNVQLESRLNSIKEDRDKKSAKNIVAYILEKYEQELDPKVIGAAMVQGLVLSEDEFGTCSPLPVISFLEGLVAGAREASCITDSEESTAEAPIKEESDAEPVTLDNSSINDIVRYVKENNSWPKEVNPSLIAKASIILAGGNENSQ